MRNSIQLKNKQGSFLVRDSRQPGCFAISVKSNEQVSLFSTMNLVANVLLFSQVLHVLAMPCDVNGSVTSSKPRTHFLFGRFNAGEYSRSENNVRCR